MSIINVNGTSLRVSGRVVKVGAIYDEYWLEKNSIPNPEEIIEGAKANRAAIDIFTFSQRLPDVCPRYPYYMEWDNVAALPITTFEHWWTSEVNDKTRNMVRKAQKKGVVVKLAAFDDRLVDGIARIYNETPVRQGRPFSHFGKTPNQVRGENASYLERSDFLAAYTGEELIGFIKLVYTGEVAGMMQILSQVKARDKAPNNALVAKAVEVCAKKGIRYLTYSKFIYGKKGLDPIAEFKHHNGFQKIDFPKYYVPLTEKGKIGLLLGLHREFNEILPPGVVSSLRKIRTRWYMAKIRKTGGT